MRKHFVILLSLFNLFSMYSTNLLKDTTVIIEGVPNYLWYQNCALTCHTMIAGYYAKSIPEIIPGNISKTTTDYKSLTDLLCYQSETDDQFVVSETGYSNGLLYYLHAPEYGLEIPSRLISYPFYSFEDYTNIIDNYKLPLIVSWHDEPYGAHATIGVGYQIKNGKGYIILHDTWVNTPVYIDYEEHKEAMDNDLLVLIIDGDLEADRSDKEWSLVEGLQFRRKNLTLNNLSDIKNIRCVLQSDIKNNGMPELLMADFNYYASPKLSLFSPDFLYNEQQYFINEEQFNIFSKLFLSDLNNDHYLDLIATGYWCNVHIYKGMNSGFYPKPHIIEGPDNRGYMDVAIMNVDQDDDLELVCSSVNGKLCFSKKNNELDYCIYDSWDFRSHLMYLEAVDLDLDGNQDLVASLRSGTVLAYYYRNGQLEKEPSFHPKGHGGIALAVGDVDNDGYPDIIGLNDRKIVLYKNNFGKFNDDPIQLEAPNGTPIDIVLEDLTGDGYPELIVSNFNSRDYILRNNNGELNGLFWQSSDNSATFGSTLLNVEGDPCIAFYKGYGQELEVWQYESTKTDVEKIIDEIRLDYHSHDKSVQINTNLPGKCTVLDMTGRIIKHQSISQGNNTMDLSNCTSTIVVVVFNAGTKQKTLKIAL